MHFIVKVFYVFRSVFFIINFDFIVSIEKFWKWRNFCESRLLTLTLKGLNQCQSKLFSLDKEELLDLQFEINRTFSNLTEYIIIVVFSSLLMISRFSFAAAGPRGSVTQHKRSNVRHARGYHF